MVRYGLLAGNIAVVLAAVIMVVVHSNGVKNTSFSALNTANETKDSNPLDTLSATDIAKLMGGRGEKDSELQQKVVDAAATCMNTLK